jgi:hypothetical protein
MDPEVVYIHAWAVKTIKGAQAWDIRDRVIHTEQSHLDRRHEDWTNKTVCVKCSADIRHFDSLPMTEYAVKIIPRLLSMR